MIFNPVVFCSSGRNSRHVVLGRNKVRGCISFRRWQCSSVRVILGEGLAGTGRGNRKKPGSGRVGLSGESSGGGKKRKRRSKVERGRNGPRSCQDAKPAEGSEEILQEYECRVRAIYEDDGIFVASLIDLTAGETWPSDTAEFSIGDVSGGDRKLFRKGPYFTGSRVVACLMGGRSPLNACSLTRPS